MKNRVPDPVPGTVIRGKWHHKTYRVLRPLGSGTAGDVCLAEADGDTVAVKIGRESASITSEVNVLRKFSQGGGHGLGPALIDVDDWPQRGRIVPFYAMEYLQGQKLLPFIGEKGEEWIGIMAVQLLADLDRLHRGGWVFGDLKPDNLVVGGPPPRIRWFDVGGITALGRSVREYTEFFDRGYWGLGTRRAEASYDLFSVGMIMVNCAYPARFERGEKGAGRLRAALYESPLLERYRPTIIAALDGRFADAPAMRRQLMAVMNGEQGRLRATRTNRSGKGHTAWQDWGTALFLAGTLLAGYILYANGTFSF